MQTEVLTFIADFRVLGRFAYLSHQETLSFWQRVLTCAQVPVLYSQGFNPRPRLSLPLPRSVGVQSDCERLCAAVAAEDFCPEAAGRAVAALLPEGCLLTDTSFAVGKAVFYPVLATYQFTLTAAPDAARRDHLEHCIKQLQTHEPVVQPRRMENNRQRPVDIRPFLEGLSPDETLIQTVCAIRPTGTVRIDELMHWLGLEPCDLAEPVRRIAVQWACHTKHFQGEYHLS